MGADFGCRNRRKRRRAISTITSRASIRRSLGLISGRNDDLSSQHENDGIVSYSIALGRRFQEDGILGIGQLAALQAFYLS